MKQDRRVNKMRMILTLSMAAGCLSVLLGATSKKAEGPGWAIGGNHAHMIPAFARLYGTGCSTCHTAAPKLNVLGEAFRLNGYQMPESDLLERKDEPVPLGNDAWKDLWPRAIWPSELTGLAPFALRIQSDMNFTRSEQSDVTSTFRFPAEVYLLAGAPLDDDIGAFFEAEWSREDDFEVRQAKVTFQDPIPGLPKDLLNVWVGQQDLFLFTFANRQIDRAGRLGFAWQFFRPSSIVPLVAGGSAPRSENGFQLARPQPAIEANGLLTPRLFAGIGIAQGTDRSTTDNNDHKDLYYKVRYKFGGLDYQGAYAPGGGPPQGAGGQLLDRSLTIEHFAYFGREPVASDEEGSHRSYGFSARGLYGPWDVGLGYVRSEFDRPWGAGSASEMETSSVFGKAEYLLLPWLIGSMKVDRFLITLPGGVSAEGFEDGRRDRMRFMPGVILLVRQNIRGVIEGELFSRDTSSRLAGLRRPNALWVRLDLAF